MERMSRNQCYIDILNEELLPAMGCTEPIAVAYAAAIAKSILGVTPQQVTVQVSGNIIKNVKSVIVPNTGGMKGIAAAVAAGCVAGRAEKKLEVISEVSGREQAAIKEFIAAVPIEIKAAASPKVFYIDITVEAGGHCATVCIADYHTNIVLKKHDQEVLFTKQDDYGAQDIKSDRSILNVQDIIDFANTVELAKVKELLDRQIAYNTTIAEEGLKNNYGANIGKVLLDTYGDDIKIRAKAKAAAGSDARMNGCELPVVIVSGSGNQGITASIPVIEYARELKLNDETLYRALLISNLVTIHLKTGIGRLSAYCGAISAGCGSGAGIAYLSGGRYPEIAHTIVNSLAIASGIICDGAKASCAAKIALAVEAGIFGYYMYVNGQQFRDGDGIVTKGVENTIRNVGELAHLGMRETDKQILKIMLGRQHCSY